MIKIYFCQNTLLYLNETDSVSETEVIHLILKVQYVGHLLNSYSYINKLGAAYQQRDL